VKNDSLLTDFKVQTLSLRANNSINNYCFRIYISFFKILFSFEYLWKIRTYNISKVTFTINLEEKKILSCKEAVQIEQSEGWSNPAS